MDGNSSGDDGSRPGTSTVPLGNEGVHPSTSGLHLQQRDNSPWGCIKEAVTGGASMGLKEHVLSILNDNRKWTEHEFRQEERQEPEKKEGRLIRIATRVAKFLTFIVTFGGVIAGGLTVKSTILILANAYTQNYSSSYCTSDRYTPVPGSNYERYTVMLILMTCLCFPDAIAILYATWRLIKKTGECALPSEFTPLISDSLDAIGQTFLVLMVIPKIDATLAVILFSFTAFLPAVLKISKSSERLRNTSDNQASQEWTTNVLKRPSTKLAIRGIALVLQLIGVSLVCWQIAANMESDGLESAGPVTATVVCLIFVSVRHVKLGGSRRDDYGPGAIESLDSRYEMVLLCSILRIVAIVGCCFLIHFAVEGNGSIVANNLDGTSVRFAEVHWNNSDCDRMITSFWNTGITNMFVSLGTFYIGVVACQTKIQRFGFTLPLALITPVMSSITGAYSVHIPKSTLLEFFKITAPSPAVNEFIGWRTSDFYIDGGVIAGIVILGLVLGVLPMLAVASHMWTENEISMSRIENLFDKSNFAGPMICEDMMMNRSSKHTQVLTIDSTHRIPRIVLCVTLWHETDDEMKQILTSIMRLDKYQKKANGRRFEFEVHVFFDGAIEKTDGQYRVNEYVEKLMKLLPVAADIVVKDGRNKMASVRMETPYGGRIQLPLPQSERMMYIHLKDAEKIRKKKRWSQCMYLNYILRYLTKEEEITDNENIDVDDLYILALDGDVDFQPQALLYLLNIMEKNENVGAACGRIHPIGSGPVVWFQNFEYAVGHWLQKSAEDILGCVLCSPGCFSLFRGKALSDVNVGKTYMQKATEARHKVQWDQGEDRWLCTLLLKQGYKIEYCATSDSYTFAPENFDEFYKQRRRWTPSTIANILDLLLDARLAVKENQNISWGYIAYQMLLTAASLLGPSTVVLIVQGALLYVFGIPVAWSMVIALAPVIYFTVICYTSSEEFQIKVASVLTLLYGLLMMAALVGVLGDLAMSLLNPTSLFMLSMIALFAFTGLLHPTEWTCLIHGILYYICVPSAFIFLPIYSYCNLDNISWGTREDKSHSNNDEDESNETQLYSCGWGNICRCQLCIKPKKSRPAEHHGSTSNETQQILISESTRINRLNDLRDTLSGQQRSLLATRVQNDSFRSDSPANEELYFKGPVDSTTVGTVRLTRAELGFWNHLINKHLGPETEEEKRQHKMKIAPELKELKNKMSGAYLFINSLWLVLTFSLALVVTEVHITLVDKNGNVSELNPLSFAFLLFFIIILTIQFVCMLFHRWDTFLLRMAETQLIGSKEKRISEDSQSTNMSVSGSSSRMENGRADASSQHMNPAFVDGDVDRD